MVLARSIDGGAVWTQNPMYFFETDCAFALCPDVPGVLLFGGLQNPHTIMRSTDYGETVYWDIALQSNPYGASSITQDPHNLPHLIATAVREYDDDTKFYDSFDHGETWTESPYILLDERVTDVHFSTVTQGRYICATDTGIYLTNDGENYSLVHNCSAYKFEYDPTRPGEIYAACDADGILLSTDDGATWSEIPSLYRDDIPVVALEIVGGDLLYAGTNGFGMFRIELDPSGIEESGSSPALVPTVSVLATPTYSSATVIVKPNASEASLSVYDVSGRLVHSETLPPAESARNVVVRNLAPGVYFTGLTGAGDFAKFVILDR